MYEKRQNSITLHNPISYFYSLQNLTEYNTAHNRKISTLGINDAFVAKKGSKRKRVHFNEDEIVINPEDIDDSIGKFRNLVQSTVVVVSNKRMRMDGGSSSFSFPSTPHIEQKHILHHPIISAPTLYAGLPAIEPASDHNDDSFGLYASTLLPALPNPAPEIEVSNKPMSSVQFKSQQHDHELIDFDTNEPKRKKYAKEAWPKKAPKNHLGEI
jgi:nuclear inhibitor of protein phosphatase 1